MKRIADPQEWKMPATIDDPLILEEIDDSLAALGYGSHGVIDLVPTPQQLRSSAA